MEALIQRVSRASVTVDGKTIGEIGPGLCVFVGVADEDTEDDVKYLADKLPTLRIFSDQDSKFNLSAIDVRGHVLIVSQFTLLADTRKGRRPGFTHAAPPDRADALIEMLVRHLRSTGLRIQTGQFQAHMQVEILNDGPVTIPISSKDRHRPRRQSGA